MFARLLRVLAPPHPTALAIRGRAIRTFGGQALILTISLVFLGVYLIVNEFNNPLSSQSLGLFTAAFVLATAMSLVIELTQLFRTVRRHSVVHHAAVLLRPYFARPVRRRSAIQKHALLRQPRPSLPYHRCYVDRVRVRA